MQQSANTADKVRVTAKEAILVGKATLEIVREIKNKA
jgi:hypothetical protein